LPPFRSIIEVLLIKIDLKGGKTIKTEVFVIRLCYVK
jgi:hypothetical protein